MGSPAFAVLALKQRRLMLSLKWAERNVARTRSL